MWIFLNLIGMRFYLQQTFILRDIPKDIWDPFDAAGWILVVLPAMAALFLLNLTVLNWILTTIRGKSSLYLWILVSSLWIVIIGYDHYRAQQSSCSSRQNHSVDEECSISAEISMEYQFDVYTIA